MMLSIYCSSHKGLFLSLKVSWGDVATVCHSHHQRDPVCGGVCQAHLWLHGPLSERSDYPPQSRSVHETSINTPCSQKFTHCLEWTQNSREPAVRQLACCVYICYFANFSCDTESYCHLNIILPSSGSWLSRVQLSHASNMTWNGAWLFWFRRIAGLVLIMLLPLRCLLW